MAKTTRKRVSHRKREVCRDEPLHIGIQLLPGLPSMRTPGAKLVVFEAIRAMRGRFGFRIVEFAVMSNHIHMLCEAKNNDELAAAMKSFKVRLARGFNKLGSARARSGRTASGRVSCARCTSCGGSFATSS